MFKLVELEDKITCTPDQLSRDPIEVLIEQIEIKFSNKILLNVGLCIAFYDFVNIEDPYIYPGAGSAIQLVRFRLVVFCPFIGEIITGKISHIDKDGLKVSVGFFEDISIPVSQLQSPSTYDPSARTWTWDYEGESEAAFILELGDEIRFKVRSIGFTEIKASAKGITATTTTEDEGTAVPSSDALSALSRRRSTSVDLSNENEKPSSMHITACINDFGLGSLAWW